MSQTYEIIRSGRGKTTVEDTGPLGKMQDRLRQLRASTRGGRVSGRGGKKYTVVYELRKCSTPVGDEGRCRGASETMIVEAVPSEITRLVSRVVPQIKLIIGDWTSDEVLIVGEEEET